MHFHLCNLTTLFLPLSHTHKQRWIANLTPHEITGYITPPFHVGFLDNDFAISLRQRQPRTAVLRGGQRGHTQGNTFAHRKGGIWHRPRPHSCGLRGLPYHKLRDLMKPVCGMRMVKSSAADVMERFEYCSGLYPRTSTPHDLGNRRVIVPVPQGADHEVPRVPR